jgi:bifunctional DNA-binding transcriptional regulator/antitoxin component of YhaV-PrlF toxin-antitoxin module
MTVVIKNRSPITVPEQVRRLAGFKAGDRVEFRVTRGVVTIRPRPAAPSASESLTPGEARKVRHALKQVRDGKTVEWANVKHELGL